MDTQKRLEIIRFAYQILEGQLWKQAEEDLLSAYNYTKTPFQLLTALLASNRGVELKLSSSFDLHLSLIHEARMKMCRLLLPPSNFILDLGGAHAPIHHMGYSHPFKKLKVVDLEPQDRHEEFRSEKHLKHNGTGEATIVFEDMTKLTTIEPEMYDLVWSGQSIEHITTAQAEEMCASIKRVLRPGGYFCLDTPNGLITSLHAKSAGLTHIHSDHKIEYTPIQLKKLMERSGFKIVEQLGIIEMPLTEKTGEFNYLDFSIGGSITKNVDGSYIQFLKCQKQ